MAGNRGSSSKELLAKSLRAARVIGLPPPLTQDAPRLHHGAIPLARTSFRGASAAGEAGIHNPSGDWRSETGVYGFRLTLRSARMTAKVAAWTPSTPTSLILGAGGAGLFAALHAKKARPELDVTIAVKGLLGKCGCTRMVQGGYNVALAPSDSVERHFMDTIEGGGWLNQQELAWLLVSDRADAHPRTGERDRLLLRPQSRRHRAPEGVRRADLRPHRAQGRSHRHRDHQPAVRAGLAARRAAAGGSPRARSDSGGRRLGPRRRATCSTCAPASR